MLYAIVDIETTGGHASGNGITEIAIVVHDGEHVLKTYESLVHPEAPIPVYIQSLTGITPDMVEDAPVFEDIAEDVYNLLNDKVFVAHHVNFDYSFVKYHLEKAGFTLNCSRLCTVRLSRKIFAGLPSYSLGNLCRHFNIRIQNRHRAGGDAAATAILFARLLRYDIEGHILKALKKGSKENILPPFLPAEKVKTLPYTPGVYYFHNQRGKVIYVGKAKNLRYRVNSHFSNNSPGRKRQGFLRNIYDISYEQCATELMAFLLEAAEIKRLWPDYNQAQKRFEATYALFAFEDQNGYKRLVIEKRRRLVDPLFTFNILTEGYALLKSLIKNYQLCPRLCFLQKDGQKCSGRQEGTCLGACEQEESPEAYNLRVNKALASLDENLPTLAVIAKGRHDREQSCILMERGKFYGMGYFDTAIGPDNLDLIKDMLTPYPDNEYVRQLIRQHASRFPEQIAHFPSHITAEHL